MAAQLAITVPVLIWLVMIFRREDFHTIKPPNAELAPVHA
jgi:hypothetical protein